MSTEIQVDPTGSGPLETEVGTIVDLRVQHYVKNVFWREGDREGMAATGAFAAALGLSGPAAGMAMMSAEEMEEPVTKVEFRLGEMAVEGLLWNWPFNEGDIVRVVGARNDEGRFFAISVLDEDRRLIVSYPHVSAGTLAHWISVLKYSLVISIPWWGLVIAFYAWKFYAPFHLLVQSYLVGVLVFCVIGYRVGRRFVSYAKLADSVFSTLGWKGPRGINLRRVTKRKRQAGDHVALGDTYFRY
ncbi:hypothetical protein LMF57_16895 [Stenotrophomonas sp. SI-NJAU-1]|jgi:hypothetical protein|uniref:putative type VI secretion system effector n=1 Tax=unclassified Stenotrophomonas TaxID=196198 RepID=UPI0013C33C2C|nr:MULTISPECIES: putative type VI secretion system effector [unclassified Stenotrophomonas]UEX17668.1 hypothetical protein LMF57_16895 [Stenotrophomonas sp. SI-NJAU-1]